MKTLKFFLFGILVIFASVIVHAQDSLSVVSDIVNTGVAILDYTGNTLIKGVPNSALGGLVTAIILGIFRFYEKRKLIKRLTEAKDKSEAKEVEH